MQSPKTAVDLFRSPFPPGAYAEAERFPEKYRPHARAPWHYATSDHHRRFHGPKASVILNRMGKKELG